MIYRSKVIVPMHLAVAKKVRDPNSHPCIVLLYADGQHQLANYDGGYKPVYELEYTEEPEDDLTPHYTGLPAEEPKLECKFMYHDNWCYLN